MGVVLLFGRHGDGRNDQKHSGLPRPFSVSTVLPINSIVNDFIFARFLDIGTYHLFSF